LIVAASWDAVIFDLGDEPLRKVPTMEPMRGTKAHVQGLFDRSADASELLKNLSS
jgi:proteasome accessory factor A